MRSSELERVWTEAYKKALSRGFSEKKSRQLADRATAEARAHGGEGPIRGPRKNLRVERILKEQAKRAEVKWEKESNAPESILTPEEYRKQLLENNKLYARRHAQRLKDVTPLTRIKTQNDMLKRLNSAVDRQVAKHFAPTQIPFERFLSHQEITNKVSEELAKRLAGPTQWRNWTQAQRDEAMQETRYWEERIYDYEHGLDPNYELREFTPEMEANRRLSEESLSKRTGQIIRYSANEKGERGRGELGPIERTPYMSSAEMDREIFKESVKWTGARIKGAGVATGAAIKGGAKTAAKWGGRALTKLGSGAVAGPAGAIAMGALTAWDIGSEIYGVADENLQKMRGAQWPLTMAGLASLAMYGNMLVNSGIAETIDLSKSKHLQEIGMAEDETRPTWQTGRTRIASRASSDFPIPVLPSVPENAEPAAPAEVASSRLPWPPAEPEPVPPSSEFPSEIYEGGKPTREQWNGDLPTGFGPVADWNDMVDTVLGNITGQGIEGEPSGDTANEIVETFARVYGEELKKGAKEAKDTGVVSASPGEWFGSLGWDSDLFKDDRPAEEIEEAFDPWTQFNPRDQSSLEAHGADVGRGIGGSASEELQEMMAHTTFLQKIADNTKEDEIAVLGV